MDYEQNNLNQDNFNTQGNNGIPNNQPLNNQNFNQGMSFNQQPINSQPQQTSNFQQPINQINMQQPTLQPVNNSFENVDLNNQNSNNKPPKKMNIGLIIGILAVIAVVVVGIVFGSKLLSNNNIDNENLNNEAEKSDKNTNTSANNSSDPQLVIYLNNLKITLGKTTMDEIIKNTNLKIIKDETNKYKGSTSNNPSLSSEDWIYYDKRIIQLSDGINVFVIESYFEKTNIVGKITTLRDGKTDDPAFDNSKGTTLSFEDAVIGKRINIGDMYTDFEHEIYNNSSAGSCNKSGYDIYCYQSKHLSDDMFVYYLNDNQKVVNMTATLMSYYH